MATSSSPSPRNRFRQGANSSLLGDEKYVRTEGGISNRDWGFWPSGHFGQKVKNAVICWEIRDITFGDGTKRRGQVLEVDGNARWCKSLKGRVVSIANTRHKFTGTC